MKCKQCGASFDYKPIVDRGILNRLANLVEGSHRLEIARILKDTCGYEITNAKGVAFHLADPSSKCHRCKRSIASGEMVDCADCQALNIQLIDKGI